MGGIKAAADTSTAATAIFVRVIVLSIRSFGKSPIEPHDGVERTPRLKYEHHLGPVFRERPPLGITLACGFEIDLHGRSCAMRAMAINSSGSPRRQGQSVGNAHLRAAAARRTRRRFRLWPCRLRHGAD